MSPTVDGQIVSQRTISDLALDSLNNSTISHSAKTMAALQNSLIIMALSERYLMPRSIGRLLREAALQPRARGGWTARRGAPHSGAKRGSNQAGNRSNGWGIIASTSTLDRLVDSLLTWTKSRY
jgi:hypothetical protein